MMALIPTVISVITLSSVTAAQGLFSSFDVIYPTADTTIYAGQEFNIQWGLDGQGCPACISIVSSHASTILATCAADAGIDSYSFTMPSDAPAGQYTLGIAQCMDSQTVIFTVSDDQPPSTSSLSSSNNALTTSTNIEIITTSTGKDITSSSQSLEIPDLVVTTTSGNTEPRSTMGAGVTTSAAQVDAGAGNGVEYKLTTYTDATTEVFPEVITFKLITLTSQEVYTQPTIITDVLIETEMSIGTRA